MHSYLLTGLRMGPLARLLRERGFSPTPRNLARLLFVMQNGLWASILTRREKARSGREFVDYPVPRDAVFIIGHWRTGSTFLHQLLSQDSRFVAPTMFQAAFPDCFRVAARYYRPIMRAMVVKRPMDHVRMGFDDAQEDEFALLKLTLDSPLLDIVFPVKKGYFISHYDDFIPSDREGWKEKLMEFCRRLRRNSGRTLLLKNPLHSLRIPLLLEAFPDARFIHIHRHPYRVAASSMNLWKVMIDDNLLKGKPYYPTLEEVTDGMKKFYDVIERDSGLLAEGKFFEISCEALVGDPVGEISALYSHMGLEFTSESERTLHSYLESTKDFRKNSYIFTDREKEEVYSRMERVFNKYHYER